jgi:UDP-N-acetylmuramyl pentapeptide phosphotransferase/UDP-N-acetylglucosamine-1-phosphate transferase
VSFALALVGGALAAWVLLAASGGLIAHPVLQRRNYRDFELPTAIGLLLVAAVLAFEGVRTLAGLAGLESGRIAPERLAVAGAVVVFGFLGLVDDLLGDGGDRGLRGHIKAALHGRVTTGFIKLGGGAAAALVIAAAVDGDRPGRVIVDAAVIALAANIGNLLDRAPGRTLKWGLLAYLPLALAAGLSEPGPALAAVAGASAVLLAGDLRERFMLGDTGANALGAALGAGVVLVAGFQGRVIAAGVLLALTLLSEVFSFSRIIEGFPPLRAFDRLGRLPRDRAA